MARNKESVDELGEAARSELNFERGDDRDGRVGDQRSADELQEEFPRARVREAGRTGGETVDGHVTADDLSPETLLHEAHPDGADGLGGESPADLQLREVDEAEIGAGRGMDEAELAQSEAEQWSASGRSSEVSLKDVSRAKTSILQRRKAASKRKPKSRD